VGRTANDLAHNEELLQIKYTIVPALRTTFKSLSLQITELFWPEYNEKDTQVSAEMGGTIADGA
jgi:hypothetical protein